MILSHTKYALISVILMLPAMFFFTAGLLVSGLKLEFINDLLELWTHHRAVGWLFSPVVILGGPAIALLLSILKVLRVSTERIHEEFVIALSVKRLFGHLACAALAGSLILFVLTYAFVENFQIIHR